MKPSLLIRHHGVPTARHYPVSQDAGQARVSFSNDTGEFSTGTYSIGQSPLGAISFIYGSDLTKSYLATSGTVTITKINDDVVEVLFPLKQCQETSPHP